MITIVTTRSKKNPSEPKLTLDVRIESGSDHPFSMYVEVVATADAIHGKSGVLGYLTKEVRKYSGYSGYTAVSFAKRYG
jgi:hypothetical protein